jgi:hypothetical protein
MRNQDFIETVQNELAEIGTQRGINNTGDLFAIWFTSKILGEDEGKTYEEYHIGGAGDNKIDIGICDDDHEVNIIIQSKYSNDPLDQTYSADLIDEVKNAQSRIVTAPDVGNNKRKEFVQKYNRSQDKVTRLIAVGFGKFSQEANKYALDEGVEIYDYEKIKQRYIYLSVPGAVNPPTAMDFYVDEKPIEEQGPNFELYTFLADFKDIYKIIESSGDGIFREDLRFRLTGSAKSRIGKEIEETIITSPDRLAILNNGITITCTAVDYSEDDNVLQVIGPQIVNGCQTSWAIYDAAGRLKDSDEYDSTEARIHVKLIKTISDEIVTKVTEATNNQNPITPRDLHANDPLQEELRHAFDVYNPRILYEHKEE